MAIIILRVVEVSLCVYMHSKYSYIYYILYNIITSRDVLFDNEFLLLYSVYVSLEIRLR